MKLLTVEIVGKGNIFPLWLGKYTIYRIAEKFRGEKFSRFSWLK